MKWNILTFTACLTHKSNAVNEIKFHIRNKFFHFMNEQNIFSLDLRT